MKQSLKTITLLLLISMTGMSCKKNWVCSRSYSSNPNDPNAPIVTQTLDITAKKKRDAKLECEAFADEAGKGTTSDLKAK